MIKALSLLTGILFLSLAHGSPAGPRPSQIFPVVRIATTDAAPIVSKKIYVTAQMVIDSPTMPAWNFLQSIQIKGRGNSTWDFPKKPFRIKLDTASSLVGMPADRDWILLANYSDKTLMRNILANEMGRRLEMDYSPRNQIVEVVLNGQHLGTYALAEDLKISSDRVPAVPKDVTGGYLLELDRRRDSLYRFETRRSEPYAVKEPVTPSMAQLYYIQTYIQKTEDVLQSDQFADPIKGYAKYIDVDSFIDWYLVNEILKNPDAGNYSSIFFHKGSGQKLKMGPIWDFDIGAGNIAWDLMKGPEGWWIRTRSPWFSRLFQDPAFEARVIQRWNQMKSQSVDLPSLIQFINQTADSLEYSQKKNFQIWDILGIYVWPNRVVTGSYEGEVGALKDWLTARMEWIDKQFSSSHIFPRP